MTQENGTLEKNDASDKSDAQVSDETPVTDEALTSNNTSAGSDTPDSGGASASSDGPAHNNSDKYRKLGMLASLAVAVGAFGAGGYYLLTGERGRIGEASVVSDNGLSVERSSEDGAQAKQGPGSSSAQQAKPHGAFDGEANSAELKQLAGDSAQDLLARLREVGSREWPPQGQVAAVTAAQFPANLSEVSVSERKEIFFRVLTPIVLAENARLRATRAQIKEFSKRPNSLSQREQAQLDKLAERYRVSRDSETFFSDLLHRVDEIPVDLALAQAANESGWGTSRFARQANNLFGEWTWKQEEGLIPKQRAEGKNHRIRVFDSLQRSVRSYFYTLNVGRAYDGFRDQRAAMREQDKPLDGYAMASTLSSYSERGQDYVEEIRAMISYNDLGKLREMQLAWQK